MLARHVQVGLAPSPDGLSKGLLKPELRLSLPHGRLSTPAAALQGETVTPSAAQGCLGWAEREGTCGEKERVGG